MSQNKVNTTNAEPILTDNMANEGHSIANDEKGEIGSKGSISPGVEKVTSKISSSEKVGSSLCKGDRPKSNVTLPEKEIECDYHKIKIDSTKPRTYTTPDKHTSFGRANEQCSSPTRKEVKSKTNSKSPARRTKVKTNIGSNTENPEEVLITRTREDGNMKTSKSVHQSKFQDLGNVSKGLEKDKYDELDTSEKTTCKSLIGIRSSLAPAELETVRRFPSETFAACQAAYLHSDPDELEIEDPVLLPLQVEASFDDDWLMGSVTSIKQPGPTTCLLSENIEERIASVSGFSTHCNSLCRLLSRETSEKTGEE